MADYSLSLHAAVWRFPLRAARYLAPSRVKRHGGKWTSPDATDRAIATAKTTAREWLARHFRILPPGVEGPGDALGDWLAANGRRSRLPRDHDGKKEG